MAVPPIHQHNHTARGRHSRTSKTTLRKTCITIPMYNSSKVAMLTMDTAMIMHRKHKGLRIVDLHKANKEAGDNIIRDILHNSKNILVMEVGEAIQERWATLE